ncbi:MAG: polysaccharide export protein [Candidatus Binatia bacterium]|nr:polysaccharide export protein [Candidatus Binatia bacterium]
MTIFRAGVVVALVGFVAAGCSAKRADGWEPVEHEKQAALEKASAPQVTHALADSPAVDLARLRRVYDDRTRTGGAWDYPIGTGDLIEISVPAMSELELETVRVSSSGTVSLPMLEDVRASGLTEKQFKAELRRALSRYMHNPHVSVHVKEYRSRQVGVLGSVDSPGLHTAKSADATILDMISEAGGLTDDSTQRLLFIPAERVSAEDSLALSGLVTEKLESANVDMARFDDLEATPMLQASDPIVIDLEKMNRRSAQFALAVPVRPGDTIMALGGGQIFVQGWVEEPGAQKMARGLTLLGAIAAAGGTSYPAQKSTVQVLREQSGSDRVVKIVDLEDIEQGRAEDIRLREGDLVIVEAEGAKLVGYGVYQFFSNVMRVGVSLASPF